MTASDVRRAPTRELGTASLYPIPSWGKLTASAVLQPLEYVPELHWPISVRETYPRMRNDSQLSGLYRGTTLPICRYVWGIDPNGADPEIVEKTCAELGLETIDQAWATFQSGQSQPVKRQRNQVRFGQFQADALKACYLGNYFFERIYDVEQDGDPAVNGGWFAHLSKLAPRAPWTVSQFYIDPDGSLTGIRQMWQKLGDPPIPSSQLVAYVFDQDPGDWVGNSLFRPCYREWVSKDLLYRIDIVNHEKAGGILITEAPKGALPAEIAALAEMSANVKVGGGAAVPAGSDPLFIKATGSDVISSINQRDEAMARAFLMMFMSLGTSSSGGNRALSESFVDWFAIAQEAIALWFRDIFNEQVIQQFVDLNWDNQDYVPKLAYRRPEDSNPLDDLAILATDGGSAGAPAAVAVTDQAGKTAAVISGRVGGKKGAIVVDGETADAIRSAYRELERDRAPFRHKTRVAAVSGSLLPDRPLRREPTDVEVASKADFAAIDKEWDTQTSSLVTRWQEIRAVQIAELQQLIADSGGDLAALATLSATPDGAGMIAAALKTMAGLGAAQAVAEAIRQGHPGAATPSIDHLHPELEARAGALEQILSQSISQAASTKAVQLSGGAIDPADVSTQVGDYLTGLSDAYLKDQLGGALSAAMNAGRLAAMDANQATSFYASELLDTNTCQPCEDVDGTEYVSAEDAASDYPAGGYRDCQGGPRCRGTVVAIYAESEPTA